MVDRILDFGNGFFKSFDGDNTWAVIRHAIAEIPERDWLNAVNRANGIPEGYITGDGRFFVVGDAATSYALQMKPKGADRYHKWYYGIGALYAMSELGDLGHGVNFYGLHAPQDIDYADDMLDAIEAFDGVPFSTHKGDFRLHLRDVGTLDEPLAGYGHHLLTKQGRVSKKNRFANAETLVIDIGDFTTDYAVITEGGIDNDNIGSVTYGASNTLEQFQQLLTDAYPDKFKGVYNIKPARLEAALRIGKFAYGKRKLNCKDIAEQPLNKLVNEVLAIVRSRGGIANYDVIILTGGGAAMVYTLLKAALPDIDIVLAEKDKNLVQLANVFGGAKFQKMIRRHNHVE